MTPVMDALIKYIMLVLHEDISPDNIIITNKNKLKYWTLGSKIRYWKQTKAFDNFKRAIPEEQ